MEGWRGGKRGRGDGIGIRAVKNGASGGRGEPLRPMESGLGEGADDEVWGGFD